ncbi:MAG: vanadium-dependent haloperoxidase [Oligoflexus sp.]
MNSYLSFFLVGAIGLGLSHFRTETALASDKPLHLMESLGDHKNVSLAYVWLDICQEATAREVDLNGARPTILSRSMAIWATAMYDAWAAYDDKAVGSRLGSSLRRPKSERTQKNKEIAISYASYHALVFAYPESKEWLDGEMKKLGFDPKLISKDPKKPEGVGYLAAQAVIDYRKNDGANQFANEEGGSDTPYSDYTHYRPVNSADKMIDPDRWQPITFTLKNGEKVTPGFLTPHWYRVKPFALESSSQFRPGPPPTTITNDKLLRKETETVLKYNEKLTDEQKAIVEFMRDGPRSTGQSGHWLRFAQDVSRRDKYNLDQDVKLYFVVANVAFDAFIACWETKRYYDSSRPWTLIRHYYKGKKIRAWAGPEGGVKTIDGSEWHPYSPKEFVTPPFPGYTSGHATVSGASAKIIELFTGSDTYGFAERRRHCELTENDAGDYVTLDLPTWSKTAEIAAYSRALGGYHIPIDNDVGLKMGRELAQWSWEKYQTYFEGTAKPRS